MMNFIDTWLDRTTMYRVVLYYLLVLLAAAVVLSFLGYLSYNPLDVIFSAALLVMGCVAANALFSYAFAAPTSTDSAYITGLILALIITPVAGLHSLPFLAAAAGLAMASKYMLAIRKQHIFNPAAIAMVLMAFGPGQTASWWVGSTPLILFVVLGGILVIRKIRRIKMVLSFFAAATVSTIVLNLNSLNTVISHVTVTYLHSSLLFLAFVMLTEPLTSPNTTKHQMWYGALVGLLFPPQVHLGSLYSTPELSLVIGNVFSYLINPRVRITPRLSHKQRLAPDIMDFVFTADRKFNFQPGQYMEWTLPHTGPDSRGNRRYFTLASSPTESKLRLGIKFYPNGSSFKQAMLSMNSNSSISAAQLGGDFTLPDNAHQKVALIGGGIGITPFRSMMKYLVDTNAARPVHLIYGEKNVNELVYTDVFEAARKQLGIPTTYVLSQPGPDWRGLTGVITAELIQAAIPDYNERLFYISGPHGMVEATQEALESLGVTGSNIKTDFFTGYA